MSFLEDMRESQKRLRDKRNMTDMRGMFGDSTGKKSGRGDKKAGVQEAGEIGVT